MQQFGRTLVAGLPKGSLVSLTGELGAGKSVLARAMIHALGYAGHIKSPTYTLIEQYQTQPTSVGTCSTVAHLDLYRLADPEELDYLGFKDVLQHNDLVIIEWPQMGGERVPEPQVKITIEYGDLEARRLTLETMLDLDLKNFHLST